MIIYFFLENWGLGELTRKEREILTKHQGNIWLVQGHNGGCSSLFLCRNQTTGTLLIYFNIIVNREGLEQAYWHGLWEIEWANKKHIKLLWISQLCLILYHQQHQIEYIINILYISPSPAAHFWPWGQPTNFQWCEIA